MQQQARARAVPRIGHILSLSPNQEDHDAVTKMLTGSTWRLHQAVCLRSALSVIRNHSIGVVVCERDLQRGTWVDVLEIVNLLDCAPPLIVASRLADERLWAEALNLGAYDVLAKPFDRRELSRSLNMAFLHGHHSHDKLEAAPKVMAAG
jgi:DNA-binding NtrC family response regulator